MNVNDFNTEVDGKKVSLYTLKNGFLTMQVTNYGGRVVSLWMPDIKGNYDDIVLGYENIDRYIVCPLVEKLNASRSTRSSYRLAFVLYAVLSGVV